MTDLRTRRVRRRLKSKNARLILFHSLVFLINRVSTRGKGGGVNGLEVIFFRKVYNEYTVQVLKVLMILPLPEGKEYQETKRTTHHTQ